MGNIDYQNLIDQAKAELELVNAALLSLSANKRASYSIDTGQTKESVTAIRAAELRNHRNALIEDIRYWSTMLDGDFITHSRPGW